MNYNVINFHMTESCNYHCKYCFAKFKSKEGCLETAKIVVDKIAEYFKTCDIKNGRINLAGGEPLTSNYLIEIIDYINEKGIDVSIITNGSLLTENLIKSFCDKVQMIGISIDSVNYDTNCKIGRCNANNQVLNADEIVNLCNKIKSSGIKLKINTVISKYNYFEADKLSELYRKISPDRSKLFQMRINHGVNDSEVDMTLNDDEFYGFCKGMPANCIIESEEEMENAYIMVNPAGQLFSNNEDKHTLIGDCLIESLDKLIQKLPFDKQKFLNRYKSI